MREAYDPEFSLSELASLAETAKVQVLGSLTQNKEYADSKWFIGRGKAEELKAMIEETGANTAIFDQELSGAQVRNLEQFLDVKIIDRTQLILDIFRAARKNAGGDYSGGAGPADLSAAAAVRSGQKSVPARWRYRNARSRGNEARDRPPSYPQPDQRAEAAAAGGCPASESAPGKTQEVRCVSSRAGRLYERG